MTSQELQALKDANTALTDQQRAAKKAAALDGTSAEYATRSRRGAAQKLFEGKSYYIVDFEKGNKNGSSFDWVDVVLVDKERGTRIVTSMTGLMYKNPYGNTEQVGGIEGLSCDTVDQFMDWILDNAGAEIKCTFSKRITPTKVWDSSEKKYVDPTPDNPARQTWVYAAKLV